jgi:hypothetical protein
MREQSISSLESCENVPSQAISLPAFYHSHITNVRHTRTSRCVAGMALPLLVEVCGGAWHTCMPKCMACIACMAKCMRIPSDWGFDPRGGWPSAWHKVHGDVNGMPIACTANVMHAMHFGLPPRSGFSPPKSVPCTPCAFGARRTSETHFGTRPRGAVDHIQPVVYQFSQNHRLLARWVAFPDPSRTPPAVMKHDSGRAPNWSIAHICRGEALGDCADTCLTRGLRASRARSTHVRTRTLISESGVMADSANSAGVVGSFAEDPAQTPPKSSWRQTCSAYTRCVHACVSINTRIRYTAYAHGSICCTLRT